VRTGEEHVVMAWPIGREGRRFAAGAAVLGPRGEICAVGRQTAAAQASTINHPRRRHDEL